MHIMIIASWYPESDRDVNGSLFRDRAIDLAANGCQVSVVAANVRLRLGPIKPGLYVNHTHGITEYRCYKRNLTPFSESGIALQQIGMIRKVYDRICREQGKPDIIHLESARCALAAVHLAREENIPFTYTEHYSGILSSKPGSYYDRISRLATDRAAHIFLISSAIKNRLHPPAEKCSPLPNALDCSRFSLVQPPETFTFCALGELRRIKGYDLLIQAFAQVHARHPDCRLVIGGSGEEESSLKALCARLGLENAVTFTGRIPPSERARFYHRASAFVCSSHVETFSIVITEAFACGVPVVSTRCGGPEDLVNSTNGILVDRDSVPALAAGMEQMLAERGRFDPQAIRQAAYNQYDQGVLAKTQLACFRKVLSDRA